MQAVRRANTEQGFTLVEAMIVVTIIGMLATLALPSVVNLMHAAKVTKTFAQLRTVAHAWDAKAGILPQDEFRLTGETLDVAAEFPIQVTAQELERLLRMDVPEFDSWGNAIDYRVDDLPSTSLLVRSANSDGEFDDIYTVGTQAAYANRIIDWVINTSARIIVGPNEQLQDDQVLVPTLSTTALEFVRDLTLTLPGS